ncbi:AI-2E family transporter [Hoeflea poritis]|uniref:AI-2E family transporter n=1 Tax=Hoeflea poritis TaxID=2993659 RepID=A0ABT4VKA5_9HYPH|nr:AI-2E family transporter [Hoeflea poritis]MDA4845142.1 AI-2E family transporter [Hoeflea poritis]
MTGTSDTSARLQQAGFVAIIGSIVLALLYFGRDFIVPIVIAGLLTSLFSYGIRQLTRVGTPSWLATMLVLSAGTLALTIVGMVFINQSEAFQQAWPSYSERLSGLATELRNKTSDEFADYVQQSLSQIELAPIIAGFANSAGGYLGGLVQVLLYLAFMLVERGRFAAKLAALVSNGDKSRKVTELFASVNQSIRRYLFIKSVVSALTAGLCYLVLKLYGVHFSELSGLLIFILNFIPYVGSFIATVMPALLALLQFETVWPFVQITLLLVGVQFLVGNIIEPTFTGRTLNLSPLAVILSLTFWSTLWGVEGAFLSVPLTVSLAIVCSHVPSLHAVAVVLSEDGHPERSQRSDQDQKG